MGARPSSFKKGGGYLNEVDATIVGYTFEVGEEAVIKKGARKGETFTPLSLVPQFEVDGDDESKDEPKTQRLLIGDANAYGDVEDDDHTLLTPEGQAIGAKSEAGLFIASLCSPIDGGDGFDEELFDDDAEKINFEPMIGTRVRLVQQVNAEKTARQGKQVGKNKKEYDRKDLLVQSVLESAPAKPAKGGKAAVKPAPAGKPAKGGKPAKVADVSEKAVDTLKEILSESKDQTLAKSKLSMAVLKKLMKDSDREAVREWLFDDDNLGGIDGVTFNPKKQTITLDDAD